MKYVITYQKLKLEKAPVSGDESASTRWPERMQLVPPDDGPWEFCSWSASRDMEAAILVTWKSP